MKETKNLAGVVKAFRCTDPYCKWTFVDPSPTLALQPLNRSPAACAVKGHFCASAVCVYECVCPRVRCWEITDHAKHAALASSIEKAILTPAKVYVEQSEANFDEHF